MSTRSPPLIRSRCACASSAASASASSARPPRRSSSSGGTWTSSAPGSGPEFKDVASPSAMAVLKDVAQVTSLFQATVEDLEKLLKPFYQNPDRRHLKAVALQKHFEERVENGGLEEPLVFEVRFLLHQLELYEEQVRQVEGKIEREMERRKSLLTTVPGISLVTAAIVEGELGDPHRFPDERAVRAFAGLDPRCASPGSSRGTGCASPSGGAHG